MHTKIRPLLLSAVLGTALFAPVAGVALAQGSMSDMKSADTSNDTDVLFMAALTMGNLTEIQTSKLALEKSSNADVKAFAQRMIDDHTMAQNELAALARQKGVMLPNKPGPDQRVMYNKLAGLSGPAFDKEYKKVQVMSHQNTLALLMTYREIGRDNDATQLAAKVQPVVEMHLMNAKQLP